MAARRSRSILSFVCGALGVTLILAATLLGYIGRSVFDERGFANRVAASLRDERVAEFVAENVVDGVISAKPDLVGLRPILVGVCRGVVSSAPFRAAVRRGARIAHHAVMSGSGRNVVLTVQDLGSLVEGAAENYPALAKKIPPRVSAAIGAFDSLPGGERVLTLVRIARRLRIATWSMLLLGIALCAASAWLSTEKRRAIVRIGVTLAALGLVLAIVARFGGDVLALFARQERAPALAGLADTFLLGLMVWAAAVGFAGLVLAAASASLLERVPIGRWGHPTRVWLIGPQSLMRIRLVRGLLGAGVGAAMLMWPLPSLIVALWLAGLVVAFAGLREAFFAALHLLPQIDRRVVQAEAGRGPLPRAAIAVVGVIAVAVAGTATWVLLRADDTAPEAQDVTACNGMPELCDRRLDQVVFPTSHNSMGGGDVSGWMFPNQGAGIRQQLADGVRGFMIDVHYGTPVAGRVKTELGDEKAAMAKYEAAVGPEGMAAAVRIRDRLVGEPEGPRDVYMCHGFCELGALPFVPELREVHDFLVANPGEVLILVIQDEGVTPQDIERCFRESGLIDFVYRGPARPPWPTLREMVESDQRVLVMAENQSAGVAWYHQAFEVMQETPYTFHEPSEFSNRPNRGGTGGSLLLMNHWIESTPMPKPSNATIVNAHDALLERIRDFRRERGRLPNLVAVDFYGVGDLMAVCRELNAAPLASGGARRRQPR